MMIAGRPLSNATSGQAAAEIALVFPLMLVLMFGSVELGHYFYQEHIVVDADVETSVKRATRLISPNADDTAENRRIGNWDSDDTVDVIVTCSDNEGFTGLYANMTELPRVRVEATVPYNSLFSYLGFGNLNLNIAAASEAASVGS
jgi:Flp pilus assembly protein TadG